MADCLFCKISKKEISAQFVYENDGAMAILDVNPRAPGHTMVIPKIHAENILDLPEEQIAPLFLTVKKITDILNKAFQPDGFTIGINHGKASGQVVEHLHIHVIPRFTNDGGKSIHSVVNNPPKGSLEEIANKIKNYGNRS
ncbi:MAG: HIT family protein [Patescibacteria group bacterium]